MAVYVDPLTKWGGSNSFRWSHSCHLYADTLDELHAFAARIGMKRSWFQNHRILPHYDLNASRREAAVRAGAVEVTLRDVGEHMGRVRQQLRQQQSQVPNGRLL